VQNAERPLCCTPKAQKPPTVKEALTVGDVLFVVSGRNDGVYIYFAERFFTEIYNADKIYGTGLPYLNSGVWRQLIVRNLNITYSITAAAYIISLSFKYRILFIIIAAHPCWLTPIQCSKVATGLNVGYCLKAQGGQPGIYQRPISRSSFRLHNAVGFFFCRYFFSI